jgi:hypothetical protein
MSYYVDFFKNKRMSDDLKDIRIAFIAAAQGIAYSGNTEELKELCKAYEQEVYGHGSKRELAKVSGQ